MILLNIPVYYIGELLTPLMKSGILTQIEPKDMTDYMHALHADFTTPQDVVFSLLRREVEYHPLSLEKIVAGYDNEVYRVETSEGKPLIVRIKQRDGRVFTSEAWAMEKARDAGVPVPKVFHVGMLEAGKNTHEVMVTEQVEGRALSDVVKTLSKEDLAAVEQQWGALLATFHTIEVDGFYARDSEGNWDFSDWDAYMLSAYTDRKAEKAEFLRIGLNEEEYKTVIAAILRYKEQFDCTQPVFCHGDLLKEHIFVDENLKIVGVIDFGMFEGNHPIHDLAFIYFESPSTDTEQPLKGYGDDPMFADRFEERLRLHALMLAVGHLAHHVRIGNDHETEHNLIQVKRFLWEL